jgi:hypothetical protein
LKRLRAARRERRGGRPKKKGGKGKAKKAKPAAEPKKPVVAKGAARPETKAAVEDPATTQTADVAESEHVH